MTEPCQWFLLCDREAVGTLPHPAFDAGVPICDRCAERVEATAEVTRYVSAP